MESPQLQYTEKKVVVLAEQDHQGLTGAGRASDSGNPRTNVIDSCERSFGDRQVPTIKKISQTLEILQAQFIPVVMEDWCL